MSAEAKKYAGNPLEMRADPVYVEINPKMVLHSKVGGWMRKHRARWATVVLFAIQFVMRIEVSGGDPIKAHFNGVEHTTWHRSVPCIIIDYICCVSLVLHLLHYTNRDMIRRQLFGFDPLVIVGSYACWFLTRGFSESCIFNETFTAERKVLQIIEAALILPLMMVAACFDSVKMPRNTKVCCLSVMILERIYQYILHRSAYGVFANDGVCPLCGVELPQGPLRGIHLSANMTIIMFLAKSIKAYATGYEFAITKPVFRLVVRKSEASEQSQDTVLEALPDDAIIGRLSSSDSFDLVDALENSPRGFSGGSGHVVEPPAEPADGWRQDDAAAVRCQPPLQAAGGSSGASTEDAVLQGSSGGKGPTGGEASEQSQEALPDKAILGRLSSRSLPARSVEGDFFDIVHAEKKSPGSFSGASGHVVEPPAEPADGWRQDDAAAVQCQPPLQDAGGSSGASTEGAVLQGSGCGKGSTGGEAAPENLQAPSACAAGDWPLSAERAELPSAATGSAVHGGLLVPPPSARQLPILPSVWARRVTSDRPQSAHGSGDDTASGGSSNDITPLATARDSITTLIAAYENDLRVFRAQLHYVEGQISELLCNELRQPPFE